MRAIVGKARKFGDDVDTDSIIPTRYLSLFLPPQELARHAMEVLRPGFYNEVEKGDILVAGENFGCGSLREEAATCLAECGISAVVADSLSRSFYRNAVNTGLPAVNCLGISRKTEEGDRLRVEIEKELVTNLSTGEVLKTEPMPRGVKRIISAGGLIPYIKSGARP